MKRLLAVGALVLVVAACGPDPGTAQPAPSSSTSASGNPAPLSPAPLPAGTAGASCRLPVAAGDAPITGVPGQGNTGHGGFLNHPSGTFAADTASMGAYSVVLARWLPVRRSQVSPDGRAYAWVDVPQTQGTSSSTLHVVDASGDRKTVLSGPYGVIGWNGADSVVLDRIVPYSDAPPQGLYLFTISSGQLKQLSADQRSWGEVSHGFVFASDLDKSDPKPPQQEGPGGLPGNSVVAYELATGKISVVARAFGTAVGLLGVDAAGNAVYSSLTSNSYKVLLAGATPKALYSGPRPTYQGADPSPVDALGDSRGLWLAAYNGDLSLYDGSGTRKIGSAPFSFPVLGGPCA